jgi:arginyl-tRNA synthetase
VITRDLRLSLARAVAAAGCGRAADPGLRPTGTPGQYAASVALTLGADPRETARILAGTLAEAGWIETAEVTGPGYLTVTVTDDALNAVAGAVIDEGPGCVTSAALAGVTVAAPPPGDPLAAGSWQAARAALAVRLTARLAAAAGAAITEQPDSERVPPPLPAPSSPGSGVSRTRSDDPPAATELLRQANVAAAVAFAGPDAVTLTLARAIPGKQVRVDPRVIARHVPGNPAYAVRYAHARAASGVRWAAASAGEKTSLPATAVPAGRSDTMAASAIGPGRRDTGGYGGSLPRETAALLDALSWLPERVATAARRGRPDEFARYLEDLASVTVDVLSSASHPGNAAAPGSDKLTLAMAARTGLAAGLGLLGVTAPDRLLADHWGETHCEPCRPPGWAASWGRPARRPPADSA